MPNDLSGIILVDAVSFNLVSNNNERFVKRLIRKEFDRNKQILKEASPFYNITKRAIAVKEAKAFTNKLKVAGCNAQFISVNNYTHREMAKGMHDASSLIGETILQFIQN